MMNQVDINAKVNLVTKIANKLRGPYTSEKYGNVIIPMAILRRFDCVLADKNEKIRQILDKFNKLNVDEKLVEQAVQKNAAFPSTTKNASHLRRWWATATISTPTFWSSSPPIPPASKPS